MQFISVFLMKDSSHTLEEKGRHSIRNPGTIIHVSVILLHCVIMEPQCHVMLKQHCHVVTFRVRRRARERSVGMMPTIGCVRAGSSAFHWQKYNWVYLCSSDSGPLENKSTKDGMRNASGQTERSCSRSAIARERAQFISTILSIMPLHVPVPPLLDSALHTSANIVSNALITVSMHSKEFSRDGKITEIIHNYLSTLPVSLKEKLLHSILYLEELEAAVRYKALKNILCQQMKCLCTGIFPQTYFKRVSIVISSQGGTLESLDLRGVWLNGELLNELQNILCNLRNLRNLHIPHMATDAVLETIARYNTSLQLLDVMGECSITEIGVESLCNSAITQNLQFVLLGNPGGVEVSPKAVSMIIKYLPKLQSLGSYPNVGHAIEYLVQEIKNITTNLMHLHDSYTDLNRINLLVKTTPMLESIFLDHPCSGVISQLSEFAHLTKVKFQRFQFEDFYKFIGTIGKRLSTIELMFGSGILDLSLLSKQCPNLLKFTCYKMDCIRQFDKIEFPYLKTIGVYYSHISPSCVKSFITASSNVEKLSLGDFLEITDDDIVEIFTTTEFSKLKHIWFPNAIYLTSFSVQILIECCPNLISLGEISGWNMTQTEANVFKEAIEAENLALKIVDYFR